MTGNICLIMYLIGVVVVLYPVYSESFDRMTKFRYLEPDWDDHFLAGMVGVVAALLWPVIIGAVLLFLTSRTIWRHVVREDEESGQKTSR